MTDLPNKEWLLAQVGRHRSAWSKAHRPKDIVIPGPGQESVWDFPRPPAVEDVVECLSVEFAGRTIARTTAGKRIIETAGAPVYCFPPADVAMDTLIPNGHVTVCEWKGAATYFDLVVDRRRSADAAYTYPDPLDDLGCGYTSVAGWIVFYAQRVDAVFVGHERAEPQPGGYYAGWVTKRVVGPIKGEPGSQSW